MYTVAIRIFRHGYLVAKHYCLNIEADQWVSNWMHNNAMLAHWDEYRVQINEIGKW